MKGAKTGGRQKGTLNKSTADIKALAQKYAPEAMEELYRIAKRAESEAARVGAIKEILDRGYGRSPQAVQLGGDPENPIKHEDVTQYTDEMRARALAAFIAKTKAKAQ